MIRALLVDDEPPARLRLRQMLSEIDDVIVVGEAGDAEEARTAIASANPDVLFLDIEMPEVRGTELAASLAEPRPLVVFATAFDQYALDAFTVDAADYLVKPVTRARLAGTLARIRERLAKRTDLDHEMAAAAIAQAQLLPRSVTDIAGFDCAAVTIPARIVGGDFYVAQKLTDRRYGLALGDVAGKGVPAGLVASSLQARLEALASRADRTPTEVIGDINSTLCATIGSSRFATLVYFDLDVVSGVATIVNAGHPAIIVHYADGSRELVESTGPALGVIPDATFASHVVTLTPGSTLVAYSDGVSEAIDDQGDELGEASVANEITRQAMLGAEPLCRRLLEVVRNHRGGAPPADDATVLVLKRSAGL